MLIYTEFNYLQSVEQRNLIIKLKKIRNDINSVEKMLIIHNSRMRSLSPNDKYPVSRNQSVLPHKDNKEMPNNKHIKRSLLAGLLSP